MRVEKKISIALVVFIAGFSAGLLTFSSIQHSYPFLTYAMVLALLLATLFFAFKTIN